MSGISPVPMHKWVVRPFVVPPSGGLGTRDGAEDRLKAELRTKPCVCPPSYGNLRLVRFVVCVFIALIGQACFPGCARRESDGTTADADHSPRTAGVTGRDTKDEAPDRPTSILLRDVTAETGITFRHNDGSTGCRYIVETMSAGLALFDYDNDGLIDIYFINGAPLFGAPVEVPPRNALYRNEGDWHFADVTQQAGVGDTGFALGVTVGDYDNDGDADLFVNNAGPDVFYRNNGDGTFTDVTRQAAIGGGNCVGAGACFLDMEGDGDLDLFVANYVQLSKDTHKIHYLDGLPTYPDPLDHPPESDRLFRNNGDGTFTDVSIESGIADRAATGMGMTCCDYDNDGDTDIYVANDVMANWLYQNDGRGVFRDVAIPYGTAFDSSGLPQSNMGVDCADYDTYGLLDFYVTSYQNELALLYRNLGNDVFHDATLLTGAGQGTLHHVTWGNGFVDFDLDGHRDLFIACGHTEDNIDLRDKHASYAARNLVLMNTGTGRFVNVSDACGDGLAVKLASRGAGLDDLDNDGHVDVVILNSRREPTVLRNESPGPNHWLQVELVGVRSNRDGVGAHVEVTAGDLTQLDEVHSGRGYQSHFGTRLHFGLHGREHVDQIRVRWIGGEVDVIEDVGVDQRVKIVEGLGIASGGEE